MKKWKITSLDVGTFEFEKSIGTYLTDCGKKMIVHSVSFLLEDLERSERAIVDTGFESAEKTVAVHKQQTWRTEEQRLDRILSNMKIDPSDIDIVINTHLHYDHCGNNGLFKNAAFYVQRTELQYAFAPLPGEETAYFSPLIGEKPSFLGTPFEVIEGDWKISEGLRVIEASGHTPGSQMVLVDTKSGTYCLTGDNAFFFENLEKNIPVGHLYSRADWFSSMMKAKNQTDHFIPSHDPLLFRNGPAVFQ